MMKTIFTLLVFFSFFEFLPAQQTNFSDSVDSFELCAFAATEDGNYIGNVTYQLGGYSGDPDFPDPFNGGCVPIFTQYINNFLTLIPVKDINHLNGVSTYDLVLISKHILGTQALSSPYKLIAADVNNSGTISIFDMIELRRMILGINLTFPNNTSWRFIDSGFVFPNPNNPWETTIPEICVINNFEEDVTKNYIGIKIGDVNESAITDTLFVIDDRNENDKFVFQLENQKFEANEEIRLAFMAKDAKAILGFQFDLSFNTDALEFTRFEKGKLNHCDENNFSFNNIQNGVISTSWVDLNADPKAISNDELFYLYFKTLQEGNLKELIKIKETRLRPEAYNEDLEKFDLKIEFSDHQIFSSTALFQNQPNPFYEDTHINFYISETQSVKLKIYDVYGNLVKAFRNTFDVGYNHVWVHAADIPGTGLYFYQLETENETLTKKLIRL